MDQVKQQIYDITGISDIVRGQTNANETATAQHIKGQYASLRLKSMQNEVSEFAQELIQIKAQIMCKHFSPDTLAKLACVQQMSFEDQTLIQPALEMLTKDPLMAFRVEVAADSMIQADEDQEKKDRIEFLTAAGGFIKQAGEAVAQQPALTPLILDMLKFGVTAFKIGRTMEGEFDKVADEMKAKAAQPQPPKPDPAMAKVQQDGQIEQGRMQLEQAKLQQEAQASQMRLQMESQRDQQAIQLKAQTDQMKMQHEAEIERLQHEHEQYMEQSKQSFEQWKAKLDNDTKVVVAEIAASTAIKTSAMSANAASEEIEPEEFDESGEKKPKATFESLIEAINQNMTALVQSHSDGQKMVIEDTFNRERISCLEGLR
jgi:hypothetical protein